MPADVRRAVQIAEPAPRGLSIGEFIAFAESRPQEERWELIEGVPVLNASPTKWHQQIATNICTHLAMLRDRKDLDWRALIGTGVKVPASPNSLPQPDAMVLPGLLDRDDSNFADDALVLFEVLSRSNTMKNQTWRRRAYASMPSCRHYVTIDQRKVVVSIYDRTDGWKGRMLKSIDEVLELPALGEGIHLPLGAIYRFTPLAMPPKRKDTK